MSGLSHTPGKRARGKTLRGFESRPLRQEYVFCSPTQTSKHPQKPLTTGLFCFLPDGQGDLLDQPGLPLEKGPDDPTVQGARAQLPDAASLRPHSD